MAVTTRRLEHAEVRSFRNEGTSQAELLRAVADWLESEEGPDSLLSLSVEDWGEPAGEYGQLMIAVAE